MKGSPKQFQGPTHDVNWEHLIPADEWNVYKIVLNTAIEAGLPFVLGGGLAVGVYSGRLRNTKDLDVYILPDHREAFIEVMTACGLVDYFDKLPYDRDWIYRGNRDNVIVDAIWAMANKRAQVDRSWLYSGPVIKMFGQEFRVIAPEELIWSKLYVLQRDRCDWPDILNLIHATGPHLDWDHLLGRVEEDQPLLKGLLSVFSWISPERAQEIPPHVWNTLGLSIPQQSKDPEGRPKRPDLLDTRPWFREQILAAA